MFQGLDFSLVYLFTNFWRNTWVSYSDRNRQYMLELYQIMAIIQEQFRIILRCVE